MACWLVALYVAMVSFQAVAIHDIFGATWPDALEFSFAAWTLVAAVGLIVWRVISALEAVGERRVR